MRARPAGDARRPRGHPALLLLAGAFFVHGCATTSVTVRDSFPLDPREDLPGPFPPGVARGVKALFSGDATRAAADFAAARGESGNRAAEIGLIEADVASGRTAQAVAACADALQAADATVPLLVACGEADAADGRARDGYALSRHAHARTSGRPGLAARADALRRTAATELMAEARASVESEHPDAARQAITEAVALAPESAPLRAEAAEVELAAGDPGRALARYREALELDPDNAALEEKAGNLALETGDLTLAVTLFDDLQLDSFDPK